MEGSSHINYQDAAERLLVALSFIAGKLPDKAVPAVQLAAHVFDRALRAKWSHETRRRRIRDTVVVARRHLSQATGASPGCGGASVIGTGAGYFITGDRHLIAWYAARRRRAGLTDLAAAAQTKRTLLAQPSLFTEGAHACS